MRDLYDCRKVKDIVEAKQNSKGKVIKAKADLFEYVKLDQSTGIK